MKTRFDLQSKKEASMPYQYTGYQGQGYSAPLGIGERPYPRRRAVSIQQTPIGGHEYHAVASGTVMLDVKAVKGAIVYRDMELALPVPEDQFIPVELTPTIVQAIHDGDLEKQGEPYLDLETEEQKKAKAQRSSARRHPRHAAPGHTGSAPMTGPGA